MSTLSDKILSYSPEQYIRFNTTYSTSPTNLGNGGLGTFSLSGDEPTLNSTGGPDGEGSWQFVPGGNNDTSPTRFQIATTASNVALDNELTDGDYSAGIWFKFDTIPTTASSMTNNMRVLELATKGFLVSMQMVYANTSNKGKIQLGFPDGTATHTANRYDDNNWHYAAIRAVSSTSGTFDNFFYYIDGQLINTQGITTWGGSTNRVIRFGDISQVSTSNNIPRYELSNFYIAPSSTINATGIAQIWSAGSGQPINISYTDTSGGTASSLMVDPSISTNVGYTNTTGADASSLMVHPSAIVTQQDDHTEVTTSFIASAEFPPNFAASASQNINVVITEILNASAELINNVAVSTERDESFGAQEFTASAEMIEAFVARKPMTASALMGNHAVSVTPSYFSLIKNLNPYLYIFNGSSAANIVNYGYQSGTFVKGSDLLTNQASPFPLDLVAEGNSWRGSASNNSNGFITFETTNYANSFNNLIGSGNFAYEVWVNLQQLPPVDVSGIGIPYAYDGPNFSIINSEALDLTLTEQSGQQNDLYPGQNWQTRSLRLTIKNSSTGTRNLSIPLSQTPLSLNNWAHIAINVFQSGINTNERLVQLWVNGQVIINQNIVFTTWTDNSDKVNYVLGSNATASRFLSDMYYDELAIYSSPLTNSQIIQHYNFISTLSPNYNHNASAITVNATSGNHQFLIISNIDAIATPITASADFVMPSVLARRVINYSASALTASALNTDATAYYGRTMSADPAIASAESKEGFALNTTYSDYIQTNITPYRYVTFDTATPYADFGSDNDYSVAATVVGGTIVNPDLGINGKSAKTAGTSYVTDGVILKESEHDDNWGTGNNSWHSSFWMERAIDDASTTGLRVLWNLNGYNDNQNIILYHYQNKLHLQINNQVGAPITITSANNVNIFDYTRHNIVINFHHNNNKNHLYIYVDAVLVLDQDINTYAVTTINNPIHVGANNEANNFPRLGVGCLITPFGDTALPVVPTNTKLIVDEIYWDKNQILQTAVTNIFNIMPDKTNTNNATVALTASAQMSMPAIITNAILSAAPATVSGQFVHPSLYLVRLVNVTANVMGASALMAEATGFVPVNIVSDVMVASATFNTSLTAITIPGPTMYASVKLKSENIYLKFGNSQRRFYPNKMMNPWLAYLRATSTEKILPIREVV